MKLRIFGPEIMFIIFLFMASSYIKQEYSGGESSTFTTCQVVENNDLDKTDNYPQNSLK